LKKKSSGFGPESREYGRRALTSPTSGGRAAGIVRSRTQATEFSFTSVKEMFVSVVLAIEHFVQLKVGNLRVHKATDSVDVTNFRSEYRG
jgi:hypothetical protein